MKMKKPASLFLIVFLLLLSIHLSGQETIIRKNAQLTHARLLGKTQPLRDFGWIKTVSPAKREALKKNKPADPLRPPTGGGPYSPPLNQTEWQRVVDQIRCDFGLTVKITVARDNLLVEI